MYGRTAQGPVTEDLWLPGKPSVNDKERRRQSVEQQRSFLEQQMQGSHAKSDRGKPPSSTEDLPANVNARATLLKRVEEEGDPPISQESHDRSVREALERKYGKHGAALRMQRMKQGGIKTIPEQEEDSFYNPVLAMGRDRVASEEYTGRKHFNPTEDVPIIELKGNANAHSARRIAREDEEEVAAERVKSHEQSRLTQARANNNDNQSFKHPNDVSFISESQLLGNTRSRRDHSEIEQSLNSESLMMYSGDPSVLFGDSKMKKQVVRRFGDENAGDSIRQKEVNRDVLIFYINSNMYRRGITLRHPFAQGRRQ